MTTAERARRLRAPVDELLTRHREALAALGFVPVAISVDEFFRATRNWHLPALWVGPCNALLRQARRHDAPVLEQPRVKALLAHVFGETASVAALSAADRVSDAR